MPYTSKGDCPSETRNPVTQNSGQLRTVLMVSKFVCKHCPQLRFGEKGQNRDTNYQSPFTGGIVCRNVDIT